jgi:hypothetical protein
MTGLGGRVEQASVGLPDDRVGETEDDRGGGYANGECADDEQGGALVPNPRKEFAARGDSETSWTQRSILTRRCLNPSFPAYASFANRDSFL